MPLILAVLLACGTNPDDWKTMADCQALADVGVRDECYTTIAPTVFAEDAQQGELLLQAVQDPLSSDYILLAVTREVDPSTNKYCERINTAAIQERCKTLVSRPHLHRELTSNPQATQDGPPPRVQKGPAPGTSPEGGSPRPQHRTPPPGEGHKGPDPGGAPPGPPPEQ